MSDARQAQQEIEFKLDLGSFTNYLKLVGFLGQIDDEERHRNGFFDSEDRRLSKAGWALRVRAETGRGLVTIKSLAGPSETAFVREEIESVIDRSLATEILEDRRSVMQLDVAPVAVLKERVGPIEVDLLVRFENTRQRKAFRFGDHEYTLEIDRTEFPLGQVDYELEVEIPDLSRVEVVEDGLRKLFGSLGIPYERQAETKLARALRHAGIE